MNLFILGDRQIILQTKETTSTHTDKEDCNQ